MTYEAALLVLIESLIPGTPVRGTAAAVAHFTALASALRVDGIADSLALVMDDLADWEARETYAPTPAVTR